LEAEPLVPLSRRDYYELAVFHNASMRNLKSTRAQVRELKMPQLKLPEYPPNFEKAAAVLSRLDAIFFPKHRPVP